MAYSEDFRGDYVNPALSEVEALDVLHVVAHPYQANDPCDRLRVLISGFIEGMPGYVTEGRMSPEEAIELAQTTETFNNILASPGAEDRRQVDIHLTDISGGGVVGVAVYDSSIPLGEPGASKRPSGKLARMTAYAVASYTAYAEQFTLEQLFTISAALGYGALLDVRDRGFERIRYEFPGIPLDMNDEANRLGISVHSELQEGLARWPWLRSSGD